MANFDFSHVGMVGMEKKEENYHMLSKEEYDKLLKEYDEILNLPIEEILSEKTTSRLIEIRRQCLEHIKATLRGS